jgi:glutamate formiminotransferase/formiminotetrahydrofolate cyclodeaminase
MQIVECIPNFSEARRPEVVDKIVAAIQSVTGVSLLDRSSDLDHNRTVVTFAGSPEAVEEAAFRAIKSASELINLDQHKGEHPRMGAADVCPFVPISGVTMDDCVAMAKRLGQRVGAELNIPVYLYEYAATRPERTNLENIRRGQYEGLKAEIETNPDRKPDFGPTKLSPAGATVIGARDPLVAFNVYLTSGEVEIAKQIAKGIRQSSGGYRYLKANGFLVDGLAQVSMNLTNFHKTPIARVVETIRREAERYGVGIHHSELIGLIPQDALTDAAIWYLQLDGFEKGQVLETRLYAAQAEGQRDFVDELAAATPAPGGGSAAAYAGAMGAALAAMVAGLSIGKKKYAEVEPQMKTILDEANRLRADLSRAVEEDASAFAGVLAAFKLPKDTPEHEAVRMAAIEEATLKAAEVPLENARRALTVMELCAQAAALGNLNAISDAAAGAALAKAALVSAGYNVRINLLDLQKRNGGDGMLLELQALDARAAELEAEIRKTLNERGGLSF